MSFIAIDEPATILRRARAMPATALVRHGEQKFAYLPISQPNRVSVLHYTLEDEA